MQDSSSITGNTATDIGGGGIYNFTNATVTMQDNSSITGNTTTGLSGGGIYNLCGGILTGPVDGGNVNSNIPDQIFSVC